MGSPSLGSAPSPALNYTMLVLKQLSGKFPIEDAGALNYTMLVLKQQTELIRATLAQALNYTMLVLKLFPSL